MSVGSVDVLAFSLVNAASGDFLVATLSFQAIATGLTPLNPGPSVADVRWLTPVPGADPIDVTYLDGTTFVPLPPAVWLFLTSLGALVGVFGRRRSRTRTGMVVIDAVADGDPDRLRDDLVALGMIRPAVFGRHISGLLPIDALDEAAALTSLRLARPAYAKTLRGAVTSQGDVALRADATRLDFGVDGAGVVVGTLSDSYDCRNQASEDVLTDDLPVDVVVLAEAPNCTLGADEGRAMMQIIHDVAPGAGQAFHTAFGGTADFAEGMLELATHGGAVVINDEALARPLAEFRFGPSDGILSSCLSMPVAH